MSKIEFHVETKTDAVRVLRSVDEVIEYLAKYGLTEADAAWDYSRLTRVYVSIPAWADEIAQYVAEKMNDCRRWGCE